MIDDLTVSPGAVVQIDSLRQWPRPSDLWIVEVLLDTGQRLQSSTVRSFAASEIAVDMLGRARTVLVTAINVATGEALFELGANTWAATGRPWDPYWRARRRRQIMAERIG